MSTGLTVWSFKDGAWRSCVCQAGVALVTEEVMVGGP